MPKVLRTSDFLECETLHDAIVLESIWDESSVKNSNRLVIYVRFYVDYPGIEKRSFLSIVFETAIAKELPWPEFDMFDFDLACRSPLTFTTTDCATGKTLKIECADSYIILDEIFVDYLTKYDRPALKLLVELPTTA